MGAMIIHDDVLELIETKLDKFDKLVWYARKQPSGHPFWETVPAEIKDGALNAASRVEEMFPDEVDDLHGEYSDWQHGFNSGALAALRYVLHAASDPAEAEEMFPMLDT